MRALPVIACASLAILSGCAGSDFAINSDTPQQLTAENTNNLCMAIGAYPSNKLIAAELIRRGALRVQFIDPVRQGQVALNMNACEVEAAVSKGVYVPKISQTTVQGSIEAQWDYTDYSPGGRVLYVYFTNGIVTVIQE